MAGIISKRMLCPNHIITWVISVPFQLFIDGFGLYCNMYRNITDFYLISTRLPASERRRRNNVYTISFGLHTTNFSDLIGALALGFQSLDKDIDVEIAGEGTVRIIASCLAFLSDMPQQNNNAVIKRLSATQSCWSCTVTEHQRHNMSFDTVANSQYHYQQLHIQNWVNAAPTTAMRDKLWKKHGMAKDQSPIFGICPCLNLVTFFPSDPCHSELSGIFKMVHSLLITYILTANSQKEYCQILQWFSFARQGS
ncbi:predicted protein [Uncinocarpus reesii 1704]|uniref:Uncharacterized protein n=1 Tax=Uncinocarpus reesii (strain UAMH 1704) TaxID=336963 RepID=C4JUK9_UNCRE|nr:uncharacterized protein UREG_04812 [Uncinocarpus reesii 1704]EEP79970.1 predicted protein [Uncinocarpus reesii 1704]